MLKYIMPMFIFAGTRKCEVLDARWSEFDLDKKFWGIAVNKIGKARFVPLSDSVLELLKAVKMEHSRWVN